MHLQDKDVIQFLPRDGNKPDRSDLARAPLTGYVPSLSVYFAKSSPQASYTHITGSAFDGNKATKPTHQQLAAYFIKTTRNPNFNCRHSTSMSRYYCLLCPQSFPTSINIIETSAQIKNIIARKLKEASCYWFRNDTQLTLCNCKSHHIQYVHSFATHGNTVLIEPVLNSNQRHKYDITEFISTAGNLLKILCIWIDIGVNQCKTKTPLLGIYDRGSVVFI